MSDQEIFIEASPMPQDSLASHQPRRNWVERLVLTSGVIGTTVALIAAGVLNWGLGKWEAIPQLAIPAIEAAESGVPANWLIVGSDSREGIDPNDPRSGIFLGDEAPGGKRTDTMMIARVDPDNGTVNLLSIPRDLWVPIAGSEQSGRVNTAFNGEGGEARLVSTIENYFGLEINHYAEINFVGFQDVVDALGGVPIWFDNPMRDPGSALDIPSAGCHVLDGFDALAFARGRNLEYFTDGKWQFDGTGDLGRTSRQQYFLRQVVATATRKLDFTSVGTVNGLIDAGAQNLAISGVEPGDLIELAKTFASVEGDQIIGHSLPVFDFRSETGAAVLGLEVEQAQPILDIFRGIDPASATEPTTTTAVLNYTVKVKNGSRVAGQAGEATDSLQAAGFDMSVADNADPIGQTIVQYGPGLEAAAVEVARYLDTNPVIEYNANLTEVVVVTGRDFSGVLTTPRAESAVVRPTTTAPAATVPASTEPPSTVGYVPAASPAGTLCE